MKEFEQRYEAKTTVGAYHKIIFALCFACFLLSGSYFMMMPFLTRFIQQDLDLMYYQMGMITSSTSLGGLIGSLIGGILLNTAGRRATLCIGSLLGASTGVIFFYADSFYIVIAGYLSSGIYYGVIATAITIFIVELFPARSRGRIMVLLYSAYATGRIVGSIVVWATLRDYRVGLWRKPIVLFSSLLALVFPCMLFYLKESVKYSFMKGQIAQAHQDFMDMQLQSLDQSRPSSLQKVFRFSEMANLHVLEGENLTAASGDTSGGKMHHGISSDELYRLVLVFFVTIFLVNCVSIGHGVSISNIMGTGKDVLTVTIGIMCGELVAIFLSGFLIEHPRVGRKRMVKYGLLGAGVTFTLAMLSDPIFYPLFFFVSKICIKIAISTAYIHQAESIPTYYRDKLLPLMMTAHEGIQMGYQFFIFQTIKRGAFYAFGGLALFCFAGFISSWYLVDDLEQKAFEAVPSTTQKEPNE